MSYWRHVRILGNSLESLREFETVWAVCNGFFSSQVRWTLRLKEGIVNIGCVALCNSVERVITL